MIEKPEIGMKVRVLFCERGYVSAGDTGMIKRIGTSSTYAKVTMDSDGNFFYFDLENLEEVKPLKEEKKVKKISVGDLVRVNDWSWCVWIKNGKITVHSDGHFSVGDVCKIIDNDDGCLDNPGFHDIIIEHVRTGQQVLHSSRYVKVLPQVKPRTAKEKLLRLLELKNESVLKRGAPVSYVTEVDFEEIKVWSESECERVWDLIGTGDGHYFCPWCVYTDCVRCGNCGYAKRHGKCNNVGSIWRALSDYFEGSINVFHVVVKREILQRIKKEDIER